MPVPFSSTQLTRVVDKRRPVVTPIRDRHFSRKSQYGTPNIGIDIKIGPEGIATAISHGVQSTKAKKDGWSHKAIVIPRFSEHDIVSAADLIGLRAPGDLVAAEPMMMRYNEKLDLIRGKFDRTTEYQCIGALKGSVVDGSGNVLVTYDVPAAVPVTFDADGEGTDPFLAFRTALRTITRTLGMMPGQVYAYCGDDAFDLLANEGRVKAARANVGGNAQVGQSAEGVIERIGTVAVENYPFVYADDDGVDQAFIADDEILIAPANLDGEIVCGPCETPNGLMLQEWYVDSWQERDPPATFVRIETNRVPLVRRPDAIYRMTVSGT